MSGRGGGGGDAGGEVSMSIEETNKLRVSLGLAPLKVTAEPPAPSAAQAAADKQKQQEQEEAESAAALAERVAAARERRKREDLLSTRGLGEADEARDDVMAWVSKNRQVTEEKQLKAASQRARRPPAPAPARPAGSDDDSEDEGAGFSAPELAGMKVNHSVEELGEGEAMILTLEDKPILTAQGELDEDEDVALENVLAREDKQRAKAFRDSRKTAKPLWEEDGQRRGLLEKYDEEEEEALRLDAGGAVQVNANPQDRQSDIRAKLAAAAAAATAPPPPRLGASSADFYTAEEMAAMQKPRKKKERRLKKKALTADELSALEVDAAARGDGGDMGSRSDRERRAGQAAAQLAEADAARRARFDAALTKANYASLALRDASGAGDEDEDDEELYRSLNKARQLAQKRTAASTAGPAVETMAEEVVRRREQGGGGLAPVLKQEDGALTFSGVSEFARSITVKNEPGEGAAALDGTEHVTDDVAAAAAEVAVPDALKEAEQDFKDADMEGEAAAPMEEDAPAPAEATAASAQGTWGAWVPAADGDEAQEAAAEQPQPQRRHLRRSRTSPGAEGPDEGEGSGAGGVKHEEKERGGLAREQAVGKGLAGALAFLKDRGELEKPVEWAGRTMDSRDAYFTVAMGGYKDVYTGGRDQDQVKMDVELALTRRDEYGRVLTPKEAFRQLCHRFHGIYPSKNTQEKRSRQVEREMAQRKAATGAAEADLMAGAKAVQQKAATPYVVLSGTVRPGQSRDAASGFATVEQAEGLGALAGGGQTPLTGNRKVEAMLGIKRPQAGGASTMPPPANKAPRRG